MIQLANEISRTVRYVVAANARTIRLCVIILVGTAAYLAISHL